MDNFTIGVITVAMVTIVVAAFTLGWQARQLFDEWIERGKKGE